MDYAKESLRLHKEWKGKIQVVTNVPVETQDDLSLAYTPGVAQPCLEIQKDINQSYELTRRWNMCLVVTDGSAVLGLGDIGPEAGMPVMEGKCVLFKAFGDVDAFPLCIKSQDVDEIVNTIYLISGSFGGVNLEDIAAPRCFEIEKKLKENYPGIKIAGMYSPPFRPLTEEEDKAVIERINEANPDFVWIGLGAPKQEKWMAAHQGKIDGLMLGVGAGFDYYAENIKRAPMWMQKRRKGKHGIVNSIWIFWFGQGLSTTQASIT